MDTSQAVGYKGKHKLFSFEVYKKFKYRVEETTSSYTAKIITFSKCFVSCFSCLAQGSTSSLP